MGAEAVEVKFPNAPSNRLIVDGSVGVVDGFLKILCMLGVITIINELESYP